MASADHMTMLTNDKPCFLQDDFAEERNLKGILTSQCGNFASGDKLFLTIASNMLLHILQHCVVMLYIARPLYRLERVVEDEGQIRYMHLGLKGWGWSCESFQLFIFSEKVNQHFMKWSGSGFVLLQCYFRGADGYINQAVTL